MLSVVALDLGYLALARTGRAPSSSTVASLVLVVLIAAGPIELWQAMQFFFGTEESVPSLPQTLKVSAVFLYIGGCVVYVELKSLLSRGYSLRILVDLLSSGGSTGIETLKLTYGDGVGVSGMLAKRLETLASLHLLYFQGRQVGPLTLLGRIFAVAGLRMRQLLRLEGIG